LCNITNEEQEVSLRSIQGTHNVLPDTNKKKSDAMGFTEELTIPYCFK